MDSTLSHCPVHPSTTSDRVVTFKDAPRQNSVKKLFFYTLEFLSRIGLKSIKNTWRIGSQNDISRTFLRHWKPGNLISKYFTPVGTVYVTADTDVMRAILQNVRAHDEGLFWDHENKKLFIGGILNDIYPEDIQKWGIDTIAEMLVITANSAHIKALRAPIVNALNPACIKEFSPRITAIADDILNALSETEKANCNAQELAFEFATTVISKLITGYNTTRENYQALARVLNTLSKRMNRLISHRPATADEEKEYQEALTTIKEIIDDNMNSATPTAFVSALKELGWDSFKIRVNLYFMYFSATETTASSINYLLWQMGREENKFYLEELRQPENRALLSKIVAETLRLHPPAFIVARQLRRDSLIEVRNAKGALLKKMRLLRGHNIICLIQAGGRDSSRYSDPECFNPNRFDSIPAQLPWYPFGTGNHVCPGQHLAYAELRIMITQIAKRFTIQTLHPKESLPQNGFFTLRAEAVRSEINGWCSGIATLRYG